MKKVFAIAVASALMFAGTNAYAQLSAGAGWLNSTEVTNYTGSNPDRYTINGLYIGAQYNLEMFENFGVAPGLYMSTLFGKYGIFDNPAPGKPAPSSRTLASYREIALNVPVNINYTIEVGSDVSILLYVGPVFQLGVVSKYAVQYEEASPIGGYSSGKYTKDGYKGTWKGPDGKTYEDDPVRKPFNMYLGGGAGVQIGGFQIIAGYDHSMLNISPLSNEYAYRSQFKLGFGLSF